MKEFLILALLLAINAFFALAELALVSARKSRLEALAKRGNLGARVALGLQQDTTLLLSAGQAGITLTAILTGMYSGAAFTEEVAASFASHPVFAPYANEIAKVQERGRYPTVDAIRMVPDHPDREALRQKFLAEHIHSEDEVRFFVEGQGLFCLHIGDEVLQVLCEADDWISVPAGTKHWFDMGSAPQFCAIRFFDNPDGWVAQFTGDSIAEQFPLLS